MEVVNGSIESRFWICFVLIIFLIFIPIFTLGAYNNSKDFVYRYEGFAEKVQTFDESKEYLYIGTAIDYNYHLYIYQSRTKKLGIFAPYCRDIYKLKPIQLKNFDMTSYAWWEYGN